MKTKTITSLTPVMAPAAGCSSASTVLKKRVSSICKTLLLVTGLISGAAACTPPLEASSSSIDAYIASLPYLPLDNANLTPGAKGNAMRDGDFQCIVQNMSETRQYDRIVAYAANSNTLYPGSILRGDSVLTGLFTEMVFPRVPETISVSFENLSGSKKAAVANPSLSSYREALSSIVSNEINGSTAANIYSEIEEVHSENQLNMALNVEASWGLGLANIRTSYDWTKKEVRSRYLVRFTQSYYTVDLDTPSTPSALFDPTVTLDDIKEKMDSTSPPVYVSSITYGRMVLFTFESEYSLQEMNAALSFAFKGGSDVKGDVSVSNRDILSKSKITAFILGGNAGTAVKAISGYDELMKFLQEGGNFSRESPGAPIAYKLAYLKDNSPARMSFTTDYEVKNCERVSQKVRVTLRSIKVEDDGGDTGHDLELYGRIWVESTSGGSVELFNRGAGQYVTISRGGLVSFNSESILAVSPKAGQAIRLRSRLVEEDFGPFASDDSLGDVTVDKPFETGWKTNGDSDLTMTLTGNDMRVLVVFAMTPI